MQKITNGFFITGTDTNVGKTIVAAALLTALAKQNFKTVALKPVASGSNSDALLLQKSASQKLPYTKINPFVFDEPISPHIAAKNAGVKLNVAKILQKSKTVLTSTADYIVIEGAGGLFAPLNEQETMADLIKGYNYPVILVVGIRVGCINHALLTLKSIADLGIKLAGWIANVIDQNTNYLEQNIHTIKQYTKSPLIAIIPYQKKIVLAQITNLIDLEKINIKNN